jgi:hypothetical protein
VDAARREGYYGPVLPANGEAALSAAYPRGQMWAKTIDHKSIPRFGFRQLPKTPAYRATLYRLVLIACYKDVRVSTMVNNQELNEQKEAGCLGITHERKYYHVNNSFVKRSLRPREWKTGWTGQTHIPHLGRERLFNEAAALDFAVSNTTIPVPKLHACFEDDEVIYLITEYIEGRGMNELKGEEKLIVGEELEKYLQQLHGLKSKDIGGPSGIIIPPYRLQEKTQVDTWNVKTAVTEEYVFCHNDLSQHNVIVSHDSLRILAIIDWEYAGYWPEKFERRFYKRLGPSVALEGEEDDAEELLHFMENISVEDTA